MTIIVHEMCQIGWYQTKDAFCIKCCSKFMELFYTLQKHYLKMNSNLWSKYLCNPNRPNCVLTDQFYRIFVLCLPVWPSVECDKKDRSIIFFIMLYQFLRQCTKFSFVKSILILQSGWYFGAYFIVFYEQHTSNLHCNSFIYLGIFKYLLYRKVFSIHHFMYGIFFVYCFLFISIHYWVFFQYYVDIQVKCTYLSLVWPFK